MAKKQQPVDLDAAADARPRVVLLRGGDAFLATHHLGQLRGALGEAFGELDTVRFDGSSAEPAAVLDECRSFGLLAAHKLVIVDDAEAMIAAEDRRRVFESYAEAPSEAATLVLRGITRSAPRLDKSVAAGGGLVLACVPPDELAARRWAIERARAVYGRKLEPDAARELVSTHGPDLGKLDTEIGKFAVAVGEGRPIGLDVIGALGGGRRELNPFAVQHAMLSGNPARALRLVREVQETSPRDAYVPLAIAAQHATLKAHKEATKPERRRTKAMFDAAVKADMNNKSGVGTPARTMEILALRLGIATRPAGGAARSGRRG